MTVTRSKLLLLGNLGNAGFTLLETLIAVAIMVMALGTILAIEGGSINASSRAQNMNIVAMLARNEMVKTEFDIEGKTFDEVDKESEGKFDPPYDNYSWKRTIKELTFPNFASLTSQNDAENQVSDMLSKLFSNYLSKAMREVTVQILWTKSGKQQSASVSTYWVDLNHEFDLSQ